MSVHIAGMVNWWNTLALITLGVASSSTIAQSGPAKIENLVTKPLVYSKAGVVSACGYEFTAIFIDNGLFAVSGSLNVQINRQTQHLGVLLKVVAIGPDQNGTPVKTPVKFAWLRTSKNSTTAWQTMVGEDPGAFLSFDSGLNHEQYRMLDSLAGAGASFGVQIGTNRTDSTFFLPPMKSEQNKRLSQCVLTMLDSVK